MQRSGRLAVGLFAFLVVAPLAVVLLFGLVVVSSWVDVQVFCLLDGPTSHAADVYGWLFAVGIGTTGIATIAGMVAGVDRIGWRFLLPPLAWFGALLAAEFLVALAISPQPCQGGMGL